MTALSLVVFRETLEAFLITAVLLSLARKFGLKNGFKTIISAIFAGFFCTVVLLFSASLAGEKIRELISEESWEKIEGFLYIISFAFLTYVVFWLHKYFVKQRAGAIFKSHASIKKGALLSVFIFTFLSVFREGFEIFLSALPILLTAEHKLVFYSFAVGSLFSFLIFLVVYKASSLISIKHVLNINSLLLILFSAGLLIRGVHELTETSVIPHFFESFKFTFGFLPEKNNFPGNIIYSVFGLKNYFTFLEGFFYMAYLSFMNFYFAKSA